MVALEALISFLVAVVFILATAALWIGFLGIIGAVRFERCEECGRIGLVSTVGSSGACLRCRHPRLLHPVSTVLRPHVLHHQRHAHSVQRVS